MKNYIDNKFYVSRRKLRLEADIYVNNGVYIIMGYAERKRRELNILQICWIFSKKFRFSYCKAYTIFLTKNIQNYMWLLFVLTK